MFDITTAIEVPYGDNQIAYAYRDHDNENMWYLVPVPRIRTIDGSPVFSVNKYTVNGGGISGSCTFEAELVQPAEAKAALEEMKGPVEWGGFTWVGGTAFFHYQVLGISNYLAVEPTLYGTNVATFHVELPTPEAVTEFVDSLSKGGGVSPFSVEYDMQVLTKLLGAKATVSYNSTAAISYEEKYRTEKDTWGRQKKVLEEVKQVLQQSGAGDVKVEIGAGGTPELEQRVRDWAWSTLETQVSDTVAAAATMATNTSNPVSATTSFETSYTEDTVVDWSTPVIRGIPVFDTQAWGKVYREIDNRMLSVQFALIGQMTRTDDGLAIANRVTITVDYPTRTTDNTFELLPGDGTKSSHVFEAPGDFTGGSFNPNFRYKFVVAFDKGSDYESGWIDSSQTVVNITPGDFGTRQVTFIGQDVPFDTEDGVDKVVIDFFFTPPEGNKALVQVGTLTANGDGEGDPVQFNSYYNMPIGATYHYRLRYMMKSGEVISSAQPVSFSSAPDNTTSGNADIVFVTDPASFTTVFNLRAFNVEGGTKVALVDLSAQYFDQQNDPGSALFHTAWNGWTPDPQNLIDTAKPTWRFAAVDNTNTAYYKLAGNVIYSDGRQVNLGNRYFQPSGNSSFMIYTNSEPYSVEIFTDAIDWEVVANVNLTFFRLETENGKAFTGDVPVSLSRQRADMTLEELAVAEGMQRDLYAFSLMKSVEDQPQDKYQRFYSLKRPNDQQKVEFYYTAEYIMSADGTSRWLKDRHVEGVLSVNLPPVPDAETPPGIVRQTIDADALSKHLEKTYGE